MRRRSTCLAAIAIGGSLLLGTAGAARAECASQLQDLDVALVFVEACAVERQVVDDDRDSAWLTKPASAVATASVLGMGGGGNASAVQSSSTRKSTGRTRRASTGGTSASLTGPAVAGALIGSAGTGFEQRSDTDRGAHETSADAFVSGTALIVPFKVVVTGGQAGNDDGCREEVTVTVTAETTVSESEAVDQCPVVVPELPDLPSP